MSYVSVANSSSASFRVNPWQMLLLGLGLPSVANASALLTLQELQFYDGLPPSPKIL